MPEMEGLEGLVHTLDTLSFRDSAADDADVPFEKAVELGVSEAVFEGPFTPRSLDVKIDERVELDYDEILQRYVGENA